MRNMRRNISNNKPFSNACTAAMLSSFDAELMRRCWSLHYRQHDVHGCTYTHGAGEGECALMLLHHTPTDGEPKSGPFAFRFGGEKRLQHPGQILLVTAYPRVRELDHHARSPRLQDACSNAQCECTALWHSIAGVRQQV